MAIDTGIGISLSLVTTTQQAPLGLTVISPAGTDGQGERTYIYVSVDYSDLNGQIAGGDVLVGHVFGAATSAVAGVSVYSDVLFADVPPNADPGTVIGVSQQLWTWLTHYPLGPGVNDKLYGFLLKTGEGSVICDGTAVTNIGLIASAAAGIAATSGGVTLGGFGSLRDTSGAGAKSVRLDCKG
mgnify:CR=1 FL=1|tara:strand:- start:34 stop:585 length:552 start_codon:yes stop_codon:yes gene_type:complete